MQIPYSAVERQWYACRFAGGAPLVCKQLELDGIQCYRTRFAPGIVFLRCTRAYADALVRDHWGSVFFYRNAKHTEPEPINDRIMANFVLVTSASDELIPLGEVSEELLRGDRVRVTEGLFKDAEGVVKRVKGSRRLIVAIEGITAVATCYIRPDYLKKI